MKVVLFCPFCVGSDELEETSGVQHISADTHEPVLTVRSYRCKDCGGRFTVTDGYGGKVGDTVEKCTVEKCTVDKEECVKPSSEWFEQKYYETLRELEKTKYLLDLTVKEGMKQ